MAIDRFFRRRNRTTVLIMLLIEAAILFGLGIVTAHGSKVIDASVSDWQSIYAEYDEGWYVDEDIVHTDGEEGILYGPFVPLKKGVYSVAVEYECSSSQRCYLYASSDGDAYDLVGTMELSRDRMRSVYSMTLEEDAVSFDMIPMYNGQGSVKIRNIEIRLVPHIFQKVFLWLFLLFVLFDLWICFGDHIDRKTAFWLCMITLLVSLPLFVKGIRYGHDIIFHLARVEGLAEELRGKNIPARLSTFVLEGYGYPASIYYGDLLLYLPAVLRIVGVSSINAYKLYILFVNAGTTVISYICFRKMLKQDDAALLLAFTYVTAGYRIVNVYARAAVGEYSAMMFLPVVALAVYWIYMEDGGQWAVRRRNALTLALGMTGLIGTHILTTEMTVITLAVVCLVLWKKTFTKDTLCVYGMAVAGTIVLNLYFLVPFLDYYINVDANINHTISDMVIRNQKHGAYIGQYFAFFQRMFGVSDVDLSVRMSLTPGLVFMCTLVAALAAWFDKKLSSEMKLYTVFSAGILFAASDLFPWNYLAEHFKLGQLLAQVQYPWRYIGIAVLFLTMLLCSILRYCAANWDPGQVKKLYWCIAGAGVLMSAYYVSDYSNTDVLMLQDYDAPAYTEVSIGMEEYLRYGSDRNALSCAVSAENMQEAVMVSRDGHKMEVYCRTGAVDGAVEVPLFHYKGYQVTDEYGNDYDVTDGTNNVIRFVLPAGFAGKVTIDFVEPWYWRAGELVSVLAVLCLATGAYQKRAERYKNKYVKKS